GDDPAAVNDWLRQHGYPVQPGLPDALGAYLDKGWEILAVKLRPEEADSELAGALAPLRVTFDTERPVYPVRLASGAEATQEVRLYVAAPHRMDIASQASPEDPAEVAYAGWVDPSLLGRDGAEEVFLTRYDAMLDPEAIEGDYVLERAPSDTE